MANIIKEQKIVDTNKRALMKYVATLDTAVANNLLVDVSQLRFALNANGYIMQSNTDPKTVYRSTIKRIFGSAKANGYIKLTWNGSNTEDIIVITDGNFEYFFDAMPDGAVITNPDANTSGDILISVVSPSATDALTLFIDLRKDSRDYDAGQTADPAAFNRV